MKRKAQLLILVLTGAFVASTAQAVGMQNSGAYASQYNPWRPQPQQWGYQNRDNRNMRQTEGVMPQPLYGTPQSLIPARQYEYRRYIQQVNPYYNNQMPWWSDQVAVPYGPWSLGNNGSNGFW